VGAAPNTTTNTATSSAAEEDDDDEDFDDDLEDEHDNQGTFTWQQIILFLWQQIILQCTSFPWNNCKINDIQGSTWKR